MALAREITVDLKEFCRCNICGYNVYFSWLFQILCTVFRRLTVLFVSFVAGAGDQGLMFGYATDETPECMPLTVVLAHKLNSKCAELRRNGGLPWARPDSKTQVTCEYKIENGAYVPTRVHTVVISIQHSDEVTNEQIKEDLMEKVVKVVIPDQYIDERTIYHLNVSAMFP